MTAAAPSASSGGCRRAPSTRGGDAAAGGRTLREVVADRIRTMILAGDLAPGERLFEDHLAAQLGVSRNPVREALRALESTGLVEVVPRRGAYVARFDPERTRQLLDLRGVLEGYAAELACRNHRPEDLDELRRCLADGRAATAAGDTGRAAGLHREFLVLVGRASRNEHLAVTLAPLRHQTDLACARFVEALGTVGWDHHARALAALECRDESAARAATVDHLRSVGRVVRTLVDANSV